MTLTDDDTQATNETDTMTEKAATQEPWTNPDTTVERGIQLYFKATEKLASVIWNVCIVAGAILVIVITGQVITRYIFGFVPAWGGELSRYLMIWIALLLAGVLIRDDNHLQVEFVFQYLPLTIRRIVRSVELLVIMWIGLFFLSQGSYYALTSGFYSTAPAMRFEMFWAYLIFPISGLMIILYSVRKLIEINYYPNTLDQDYSRRFQAYQEERRMRKVQESDD
ncbi:TRAP transporter small permease (plasmid) [Haloferacaceae archaeon DSL9]